MYEYAPTFAKKKEKLLAFGLLALGLGIYFTAFLPQAPYPALLQILGVFCLCGMILVYSLVIAKRYVYAIEQNEEGSADFIITEYTGRRRTVVCRVSLSSVLMAVPCNEETRKKYAAECRGKHFYRYTGVLFDEARYYLRMEECGESFWVQICANKDLIAALTSH